MKLVIDGKTAEVPAGGAGQEVYSTEETIIGRWIDGKPIYQMVIPIDIYLGTDTEVSVGPVINNLEGIISVKGYSLNVNSGRITPVGHRFIYGSYISSANRFGIIGKDNSASKQIGYLIAEYTKTTDSATKAVAEPAISIASDNTYKYSAIASTAAAAFADEFEPNDMPGSEEVETPCPKNV